MQPFEPLRDESFYTLEEQQKMMEESIYHWKHGLSYSFGVFLKQTNQLIGRVNLSNVSRGAWQNCTIGYWIDQDCQGKGYITDAVKLAVSFAFTEADLHRVQAAIMPRNKGSIRVIEKVGFQYEGLSKYYLLINGVWEDHQIFAITKENWNSFT